MRRRAVGPRGGLLAPASRPARGPPPRVAGRPGDPGPGGPHAGLTPALAAELARDPDEEVRAAVALNPALPQALRDELAAEHHDEVRYALLVSAHTPEPDRKRLYEETSAAPGGDWFPLDAVLGAAWMGHELGWLRRASAGERLRYAGSPLAFLRRAVASRSDGLPGDAVLRLLRDPDPQVQRIAALRAVSPPPGELERVVREHGDHRKIRPGILGRPDFPPEAFPRLASSPRAPLRAAAAATALAPHLLERLAADCEPPVRAAAAGNPGLPPHCLARLLTDEAPGVPEAAGTSACLPVEWMNALVAAERLSSGGRPGPPSRR
ncbi:hypothetical protein ABZX40_33450 [Streptomyces sp. NPDC004610]|uniref:hypothetical protein n=1 Tax=unclassified Streptomyces TaxID=2593676 RepID=UPI0033B37E7F